MTQKRKLFDELMDGVEAMQAQREGKITLPSYQKNTASLPQLTPRQIREVRENLILLVHKYPDTLERLAALD
jgi:putative transcriptional regulator